MKTDEQDEPPRVKFDRPLEITVMTIDGTQCDEGLLIEISDSDAQIVTSSVNFA